MILLISRGFKFKLNKDKRLKIHLLVGCYKNIIRKRNNGNQNELIKQI